MATKVKDFKEDVKVKKRPVTDTAELANQVRDAGLLSARQKLPLKDHEASLEELFKRADFLCNFKYGVAQEVSEMIAAHDARIKQVYMFEPCMNPDCESGEILPVDGSVHLLAVVSNSTAGLEAFIASLDRALIESFGELPLDLFESYTSVLNVIPVSEKDVESCQGYAAMISSIYAPPLKIWERI